MEAAVIELLGKSNPEKTTGRQCLCRNAFRGGGNGKPVGACGCLMIPFAILGGVWEKESLL